MKKFLALVLSLCMLLSVCPVFAAEYEAEDDTVFYISFDEELPEGATGYNLSVHGSTAQQATSICPTTLQTA